VGMCPICETLMRRFVSQPRLAAVLREFNVQTALRQESLKDTAKPRVDCHLSDEN
jgi:hypothetical protein